MDQGRIWSTDTGLMAEDFRTLFEQHRKDLPEVACATLSHARDNSVLALEAQGLPTNRLEYWKYSRIGKVLKGLPYGSGKIKSAFFIL